MFVHFDTYAPQLFDEMQLLRNTAEATTIVNDDVKQLVTQVSRLRTTVTTSVTVIDTVCPQIQTVLQQTVSTFAEKEVRAFPTHVLVPSLPVRFCDVVERHSIE